MIAELVFTVLDMLKLIAQGAVIGIPVAILYAVARNFFSQN